MSQTAVPLRDLLVTGATGMQGGAVARAAQRHGMNVSAMVRDPAGQAARRLADEGIAVIVGDMDDETSMRHAFTNHRVVFSMQGASRQTNAEIAQARNIAVAAAAAGVSHVVHTSVSGTGWRQRRPDYDAGHMTAYWDAKEQAEQAIRDSGVAWTIIKPGFYMENFIPPRLAGMFPLLKQGQLPTACTPDTPIALAAAQDVGEAVVQIAANPQQFTGAEIELAGDALTFPEMATVLTHTVGRSVTSPSLTASELDHLLGDRSWSGNQQWLNAVGYPARPQHAITAGLSMPTNFRAWAEQHHDQLDTAIAIETPTTQSTTTTTRHAMPNP